MPFKTPLYECHQAMGGHLVDFAGWYLPSHYSSHLKEHEAVRTNAGLFDVSHMNVIDVTGNDANAALRRLFANDVNKLTKPGQALYSLMLNESGGIIDDLIVYFVAPDHYRVVLNAATKEKDMQWIGSQISDYDLEYTELDVAMLALQGPKASDVLKITTPEYADAIDKLPVFYGLAAGNLWLARTGYTGEDGFEIMMPADAAVGFFQSLVANGAEPCGLASRDLLRLEAGLPLYGADMDESTNALEMHLTWSVDLTDEGRHFVGRASVDKATVTPKSKMRGIVLEGRGVMRSEQSVIQNNQVVGVVKSGSFSPILKAGIGLASIHSDADINQPFFVEIRGKQVAAVIGRANFVRHGQNVFKPV